MEIVIDLHRMTVEEAKFQILEEIKYANNNIWRIVAIHGYKNGTAIRDMIRHKLKHPRINKINIDMNPGVTIIELQH